MPDIVLYGMRFLVTLPQLTQTTISLTSKTHNSAILEASVIPNATSYEWRVNTVPVSGQNTTTLNLSSLTPATNYDIICIGKASGYDDSIAATYTLTTDATPTGNTLLTDFIRRNTFEQVGAGSAPKNAISNSFTFPEVTTSNQFFSPNLMLPPNTHSEVIYQITTTTSSPTMIVTNVFNNTYDQIWGECGIDASSSMQVWWNLNGSGNYHYGTVLAAGEFLGIQRTVNNIIQYIRYNDQGVKTIIADGSTISNTAPAYITFNFLEGGATLSHLQFKGAVIVGNDGIQQLLPTMLTRTVFEQGSTGTGTYPFNATNGVWDMTGRVPQWYNSFHPNLGMPAGVNSIIAFAFDMGTGSDTPGAMLHTNNTPYNDTGVVEQYGIDRLDATQGEYYNGSYVSFSAPAGTLFAFERTTDNKLLYTKYINGERILVFDMGTLASPSSMYYIRFIFLSNNPKIKYLQYKNAVIVNNAGVPVIEGGGGTINKTAKINFTSEYGEDVIGWNNVKNTNSQITTAGAVIKTNILDTTGNSTTWGFTNLTAFSGSTNNLSETVGEPSTGVYPHTVVNSAWSFARDGNNTIRLNGLTDGKYYHIYIGSFQNKGSDRSISITISGITKTKNNYNTFGTSGEDEYLSNYFTEFKNIQSSSGNIDIIFQYINFYQGDFGAIIIRESDTSI